MIRYVLTRILELLGVLLAMTFIVFLLRSVIPADPARAAVGPNAPESVVEQKRSEMGLDRPLLVQYGDYLKGLVTGDLGTSARTSNPVSKDIGDFLPASLELIFAAAIIGGVIGAILALTQTLAPRHTGVIRGLLIGGASAPTFLVGLLLLYFLWYKAHWFPSSGRTSIADPPTGPTGLLTIDGLLSGRLDVTTDALRHLLLPALTLAIPTGVAIGRTLRSSLAGTMRQDFVRSARARGLTDRQVVMRHGLRNSVNAPLAMAGLQLGFIFANLLIVETLFAWPGLGLYTVQSLGRSDLPAVLGVALVFGVFYLIVNTLIDIAQVMADPRLAFE
jgi:peptide/nickel transport system permease protein/dipeptide transport system permease protein